MKAIYTFLIGCFCVGISLAQSDIASVEYFFNTDPGIGNGTQVDIDPDVELLDQSLNISTIGLPIGTHRLFMRVINVDGTTSMYNYKTFRISDVPDSNTANITEAEFFFNVDPGIGNGTIANVTDAGSVNRSFNISTSGLPIGTHRLFFRFKNENNEWSMYTYKTFRKSDVPETNTSDIVEAEYFFDTDPGIGNGTNLDVADVTVLDENLNIPTAGLSIGTHRMFLRVKNSNNKWSLYDTKTFRVSDTPETNTSDIVEAEYFFDTDPGIGNGTIVDVNDVASLDDDLIIPTTSLTMGTHRLFMRVKNSANRWSIYDEKTFRVSDIPFTNNASIVSAEYYIDVDPGLGLATALNVTGDELDENLVIPTSTGLAQGDHYLHIRVQNTDGTWSLYDRKLFEIDGTLGLDSEILSEINIYPNPATDYVHIKTPNSLSIKSIMLIDMNGKIVKHLTNHLEKIQISNLQQGVYLLQIATEVGSISKRIIKK
ncbi:Por secretion system C-terminal sorting domain-containing protein [Bizionia echini]|uniref:Por secretion system C-terminal sorting domain-containing protein n=1 Tax=Bizionia echini TaxID=649333 RepID=A0A1I5CKK8_9FLAO|nr:T9SS type A sorting domain-containing protein [Bizionia echini]SFN87412.1 Por secretion system C-terminal sorting domain-containing protein [Bizionia echini]